MTGRDLPPRWRLPRRDLYILPLIALLTLLVMSGGAELIARAAYPVQMDISCTLHTTRGTRFRPMCVGLNKAVDGPWVENRFNACGYRTAENCAVTPATRLRVAVVGSSIARGQGVAYADTFSARASADLSHACGQTVDFQNLGNTAADLLRLDKRMAEVVAIKSRVVIMLLTPYDLQHLDDVDILVPGAHLPKPKPFGLVDVMGMLRSSHLFDVGQHYLYLDPAIQVTAFVRNGVDDMNGYVVAPLPPKWKSRVEQIDALLKKMTAVTTPAGIKVVLVYVPRRVHAVLEIPRYAIAKLDVHILDRELQAAAHANGAEFIDTTPNFAAARNFNSLFYIADGHPSGDGHALIAKAVEARLLQMPTFQSCHGTTLAAR
ncbi:SGNH/GDSL hydrolase family protein [Sphingomonas bacterium]|uniref:SGNH/GDSL hydrolase family protein n=1 Tax=Sphingomonas bacterium TaxID=1895847 RepID=UPI0015770319|nr:GDSL-type esterase/lipase family protein [Sphingomonas bacterium]